MVNGDVTFTEGTVCTDATPGKLLRSYDMSPGNNHRFWQNKGPQALGPFVFVTYTVEEDVYSALGPALTKLGCILIKGLKITRDEGANHGCRQGIDYHFPCFRHLLRFRNPIERLVVVFNERGNGYVIVGCL